MLGYTDILFVLGTRAPGAGFLADDRLFVSEVDGVTGIVQPLEVLRFEGFVRGGVAGAREEHQAQKDDERQFPGRLQVRKVHVC